MPYVRDDSAGPGFFDLEPGDLWQDLEGAYAALRASTAGRDIAAWKLGGTTPLTQQIFDVSDLYFGPLYPLEVFEAPAELRLPLTECKVELEIACRIGPDNRIDAWCLSAEMPSSGIRDLPRQGVTALVADRCAAGALVLGPPQPVDTIETAPISGAALTLGDTTLTEGGTSGLTDAPLRIAERFVATATALGFAPAEGQWIATGGMSPCVPVERAGTYTVTTAHGFSFTLDLP